MSHKHLRRDKSGGNGKSRKVSYKSRPFGPKHRRSLSLAPTAPHEQPMAQHHNVPWPLNENDIDLPDEPLPVESPSSLKDAVYLGSIDVTQRGISDPCTLDLLLRTDGTLDFGPFRLTPSELQRLAPLIHLGTSLSQPEPTA